MTTATQDGLIPRNPCLIKGASSSTAAERPTATPAEVASLAEAVPPRYKALVLMDHALRHRAQCGDVQVSMPAIPGHI